MISHDVPDGDRTAVSINASLDDGETFTGENVGFHFFVWLMGGVFLKVNKVLHCST